MKVNILLSTYNGEEFLAEQLESIQNQTYSDWTLLIRDDGSKDKTREIIREFAEKDSRIRWINEGQVINLGVIQSFHTLLKYEKADLYFFSDQDDIWLPEKVEMQIREVRNCIMIEPLLIYTDLKVVDQELNVINESMIYSQSGHANTTLLQELTENTVTGGVSVINHCLAELWTGREKYPILMHDWYLALLAAAFGELVFIDQPSELYRQHSNNVLGARTIQKRVKTWGKPVEMFQNYWKLITDSQKQARNLLSLHLTKEKRELVENYVTLMEVGFFERLRRLATYKYSKNLPLHIFVFTTLVLTKFMYKKGE